MNNSHISLKAAALAKLKAHAVALYTDRPQYAKAFDHATLGQVCKVIRSSKAGRVMFDKGELVLVTDKYEADKLTVWSERSGFCRVNTSDIRNL